MNSRILKLEKQMALIETEIREIYCSERKDDRLEPIDKLWLCKKCGSRIGILDEENKDVRIRYKDFVLYWTPAKNSVLTVVCRSCSYQNKKSG